MINIINTDSRQNFNKNWQFYLGDQPGAWSPLFDSNHFDIIDLPHDYSIDQPYHKHFEAESAYKPGGVGNYRKNFYIDGIDLAKKQVYIYFDGVYNNSTTYINGNKLGLNPYGYNPFIYDLTPYLNTDEENILAVHVNHQVPSSRWYSGSGIYRSVDILVKELLHIDLFGPRVDYTIENGRVNVSVKTDIKNNYDLPKDFKIKHKLLDIDSKEIASTYKICSVAANINTNIDLNFEIENAILWDLDNPYLYKLITEIEVDSEIIDSHITDIGFRIFAKDPKTGISLNGKNIKIKGVCLHHDQGALGAADYYSAIERQVDILKDMGANTIRLSHNPASRNLIDICNKKGMLVVNEIYDGWILDKNNNYNDFSKFFNQEIGKSELLNANPTMTYGEYSLKQVMMRDYNAPAIFMTSIGNEILEGTDWSLMGEYPNVADKLICWAEDINPNHWLTIGDNIIRYAFYDELVAIDEDIASHDGVVGLNYVNDIRYDEIHKKYPDWVLWASETASTINSRSVYDRFELDHLPADRKLSSYDISKVGWGRHASDAWYDIITRDFVAGEAVWTGFDYLGEPTPFNGIDRGPVDGWPSPRSSYFGIIDLAGFPKDAYYLYRSLWNEADTTLHLLPSWNEDEIIIKDGKVRVNCYTNAHKVELVFIDETGNITSLGRQKFIENTTKAGHSYRSIAGRDHGFSLYMEWQVPYQKGTIKAIAYDNEDRIITETIGRSEIKTPGEAKQIKVSASKTTIANNGYDLCHIEIDITDNEGNLITNAENLIHVEVSENGKLLALDNGFQNDHDSFKVNEKKAFGGKLLAIIAANECLDPIEIKITSEGLEEASLEIKVKESEESYLTKEDSISQGTPNKYMEEAGQHLLNYSTHTFPGIYPKLPQSLEIITKKGKLSGYYAPVTWDEIPDDELSEEGTFIVKGRADLVSENLEAVAFVRVEDEKNVLHTNIANLALIKETEANMISLGFATQQIFGELRIRNLKNPDIKIYVSETMAKAEGNLLNYELVENKNECIYKFDPTNATYMTIAFDGDAPKLADISLYSVKKLARIYDSTEFEEIKVNDYELNSKEKNQKEFINNAEIDNVSIRTRDNAAHTVIRLKKKWVIYLQSEDSQKIRKFTIRKEAK